MTNQYDDVDKRVPVLYFAYGSNMNPLRMKERGVQYYSREHLILPEWSLKFHKITFEPNKGAANIVKDRSGVVEGVLYEVTMEGIVNLDKYEHYPTEYDRVTLTTSHDGIEKEILTYIAHSHKTREGLKPSREYLEHLLAGEDILSKGYYNMLKEVETLD